MANIARRTEITRHSSREVEEGLDPHGPTRTQPVDAGVLLPRPSSAAPHPDGSGRGRRPLDDGPHLGPQQVHGALTGPVGVVDVDVDEATLGRGLLALALEEADAVDDRGRAYPLDGEPDVDG